MTNVNAGQGAEIVQNSLQLFRFAVQADI